MGQALKAPLVAAGLPVPAEASARVSARQPASRAGLVRWCFTDVDELQARRSEDAWGLAWATVGIYRHDVSDEAQVMACIERIEDDFPVSSDGLVNNAW